MEGIVNNTTVIAIALLFTLAMGLCWLFGGVKRAKDLIVALSSRRNPIEVTAPNNNIIGSETKGRLRTGNLIEARFWLSINLSKRPSSNVNIIPSDIKLEPEKEIEKIETKINPRAYEKRESGASFVDLSLEKDNTLIYFSVTISFKEEMDLKTLEGLKDIPMILSFYLTAPGYMENRFFRIPMKDFFDNFIKASIR